MLVVAILFGKVMDLSLSIRVVCVNLIRNVIKKSKK